MGLQAQNRPEPLASANGAHLYVMQASDGRVKIGRSGNPKFRRRSLETATGRAIALLLELPGRGSDEQAILASLAEHRGIGEWFPPTNRLAAAISAAVGADIVLPYPTSRAAASAADAAAEAAIIARIRANAAERRQNRQARIVRTAAARG